MKQLFLIMFLTFCVSDAFAEQPWDPFEPVNRVVFRFNEGFDKYLLAPVSKGYDRVMPDRGKKGVHNFFSNLAFPINLLGDLLQFKFRRALQHTAKFGLNSTLGLAGVMDLSERFGFDQNEEDLGQALAYYGIPAGPYLVLPFLGPSNLRDLVGRVGDGIVDPVWRLDQVGLSDAESWQVGFGLKSIYIVNTRAQIGDEIATSRRNSLDFYAFVQSSYYQFRTGLLYDGNPPEESELD